MSPAKKPTPSAVMAKIARNRPGLRRISRHTVFNSVRFNYHSILSTGSGFGLTVFSTALPFLMRITRSAMAQIA